VVGAEANGVAALAAIPVVKPDLITLDIEMPEMDGIEALRHIRREFPKLLGTDISSQILDRAGAGTFLQIEINRGLPAPLTAGLLAGEVAAQAVRIVQNVFETMLGAGALPSHAEDLHFESPLTGVVHYAGAWKGALILECSLAQATRWARKLMPLDPPLSIDDASDGLAELTNMIAGNLKPLLPPGVSLSMPAVIVGPNHRLRLFGTKCEALGFLDGTGPFRIALVRSGEGE